MKALIQSSINFLNKYDMFGKVYSFEEKQNKSYNTIIGTIFTILLYITILIIGIIYGQELIIRENPIMITSKEIVSSSETKVYTEDYPIMINIYDRRGIAIEDIEKIIKIEVSHFNFTSSNPLSVSKQEIKPCDPNDYSIENRKYIIEASKFYLFRNGTSSLYCVKPKKDLYFHGKYTSTNSSFLHMIFKLCNSTIEKCVDNINDYINFSFYVQFSFINSYIEPKSYNNPIHKYLDSITTNIGDSVSKRKFVSFLKNKIINDNGFLFESIDYITYITLGSTLNEVTPTKTNEMFMLTFDSPNIIEKSTRSYMKIQELIAKLGGLFNGFKLIVLLIINQYVKFSYLVKIYDKVNELKLKNEKDVIFINQKENNVKVKPGLNIIKKLNPYSLNAVNQDKSKNNFIIKINSTQKMSKIYYENESINKNYLSFKYYLQVMLCFFFKKEKKEYGSIVKVVMSYVSIYEYIKLKFRFDKLNNSQINEGDSLEKSK